MNEACENIILFEGVCNLCSGLVRFIMKRDKKEKFKFASLQSLEGQQWLKRFGLVKDEFESFVLISHNEYYLKSTGVLKMLRELGGVWKAFYVLILIPCRGRDFLYDLIAKSRYKIFGKQDSCMLPAPELKARFL